MPPRLDLAHDIRPFCIEQLHSDLHKRLLFPGKGIKEEKRLRFPGKVKSYNNIMFNIGWVHIIAPFIS